MLARDGHELWLGTLAQNDVLPAQVFCGEPHVFLTHLLHVIGHSLAAAGASLLSPYVEEADEGSVLLLLSGQSCGGHEGGNHATASERAIARSRQKREACGTHGSSVQVPLQTRQN